MLARKVPTGILLIMLGAALLVYVGGLDEQAAAAGGGGAPGIVSILMKAFAKRDWRPGPHRSAGARMKPCTPWAML